MSMSPLIHHPSAKSNHTGVGKSAESPPPSPLRENAKERKGRQQNREKVKREKAGEKGRNPGFAQRDRFAVMAAKSLRWLLFFSRETRWRRRGEKREGGSPHSAFTPPNGVGERLGMGAGRGEGIKEMASESSDLGNSREEFFPRSSDPSIGTGFWFALDVTYREGILYLFVCLSTAGKQPP